MTIVGIFPLSKITTLFLSKYKEYTGYTMFQAVKKEEGMLLKLTKSSLLQYLAALKLKFTATISLNFSIQIVLIMGYIYQSSYWRK